MKHTESQEIAIHHVNGPMLVLAGPGSGKTYVITERLIFLTEEQKIAPQNILVVTFTKAAANEMKQRYLKRQRKRTAEVAFGTFHSIFFQILRYAYHYQPSNILREDAKSQFYREILSKLDVLVALDVDNEKELIHDIEAEISFVKGNGYAMEDYYPLSVPADTFRMIFHAYEDFLQRNRLLDFDDMMIYCKELFIGRPDILKLWQQRFRYILVDEFQDINQLQYEILKMLAAPENHLFVVGDDDQSIYQFRGAKPEFMLHFDKDYPLTKRVVLNHNFRCSQSILQAAMSVIGHNHVRYPKELLAVRGAGEAICVQEFENLNQQNEAIAKLLLREKEAGISLEQVACLSRTNLQLRNLITKLMAYNIPFQTKDEVPNLYEHWIARDIMAYLRLGEGNRDRANFIVVANRPNRYIGRDVLDTTVIDLDRVHAYYEGKDWMQERVEQLEYDLHFLTNMRPYAAIRYIRVGIGYDEYIREYAKKRRISEEELFEILDELQESARDCKTSVQWRELVEQYREEYASKQQERRRKGESIPGVHLMTMHAAKGLEFDTVIIPDVNEDVIPYQKALSEEDLEEERRMFYVGMTRAKNHLYLSSVKQRYNKEMKKSRFLTEMQRQGNKAKNM